MSLVDSVAILLSRNTQAIAGQGLISTACSIASKIIEVNELFLESCMLYRTRIVNVFSDLPDDRHRIFAKAVSTMDWSFETCVALPTDHVSLLCGEIGKSCFNTLRTVLHFDGEIKTNEDKYGRAWLTCLRRWVVSIWEIHGRPGLHDLQAIIHSP